MVDQRIKYYTEATDLKDFLENLPSIFGKEGDVIKQDRNEIKVIPLGDKVVCVKSFNRITLFNRFMYSWVRASKAERSYYIAKLLLKKGIYTPLPLGYVEVKGKWGLLEKSYYVSLWQNYDFLMSDVIKREDNEAKEILTEFSRFMATKVHPAGIWHGDLSTGNILVIKDHDNCYTFSMIDLNRITFKKRISPRQGIRNLQKLTNRPVPLSIMAEAYALASKNDPAKFASLLIISQIIYSFFRKQIKRILHSLKPKYKG
ncbi:lipopolysaccharide kinase InaA family protein [Thermophagus sp. OGC60D27]|uniref:lipopolysaccharide kinase InaA family protein n=1 Tax=Thermophagus sp. OGC60D27 TaxID=3458415 RepID=UPI004037FF61